MVSSHQPFLACLNACLADCGELCPDAAATLSNAVTRTPLRRWGDWPGLLLGLMLDHVDKVNCSYTSTIHRILVARKFFLPNPPGLASLGSLGARSPAKWSGTFGPPSRSERGPSLKHHFFLFCLAASRAPDR